MQPENADPLVVLRDSVLIGTLRAVTDDANSPHKGVIHEVVKLMGKLVALCRALVPGELKILTSFPIVAGLCCLQKAEDSSMRRASSHGIAVLVALVVGRALLG